MKTGNLFKLRGQPSPMQSIWLGAGGIGIILVIWLFLTSGSAPILNSAQLPHPVRVFTAFGDLFADNNLIRNMFFSIGMNLAGYVEAILVSVPIGFLIGLSPIFKGAFNRQVNAIRYTPLAALVPLFVAFFGVNTSMKVHFLAFGIGLYLLPVVVQRIQEVKDVYLKTVYTLGASGWQTIKTVYFPSVMSKLSNDIRVLTAISWTYIIFVESMGNEGGLGGLIWSVGFRQGRADKVIAIVLIIILFGVLQDKFFDWLDKKYLPFKFEAKDSERERLGQNKGIGEAIWEFAIDAAVWIGIVIYLILAINEISPILSAEPLLTYLFGWTTWVIHLIMLVVIGLKVKEWLSKRSQKPKTK